jgi:hypothetical protein
VLESGVFGSYVRYDPPDYVHRWQQDYKAAVNATKATGKTKGKYGAIDVNAVLAHMRAHGDDGGTKPAKSAAKPRERVPAPEGDGGGGKPPVKPPSAGQSVQGADEPRRYPKVKGAGGEVPFTPANPPTVTDKVLDHILDGHGFGAGKGKPEFPKSWDRKKVRSAVEQVLHAPDEIECKGSTLYFRGKVGGQWVEVRVRGRQGPPKVWTAYPLEG